MAQYLRRYAMAPRVPNDAETSGIEVRLEYLLAWSTEYPPLHARYRLEWDSRGRNDHERTPPSRIMAGLGIVQEGDEILRQVARPFDLPAEAEEARSVVAELNSAAQRVAQAHVFGKGIGIAAPQIGIGRAAVIVRTLDGNTITLFNPRIVEAAGGEDDQYEGRLSFFDLRGQIPRLFVIHIEHTDIDGSTRITVFERGAARLVAHEIDHLHGQLYLDHMRPGVEPIPVEQYRAGGENWSYWTPYPLSLGRVARPGCPDVDGVFNRVAH